jgi:hypothetical protein
MIHYECADCGACRDVPDNRAGQRVRCQACKAVGKVPTPEGAPREVPWLIWLALLGGLGLFAIGLPLLVVTIAFSRSAPTTASTTPERREAPKQASEAYPPGMTADIDAEFRDMTTERAENYFRMVVNTYPMSRTGEAVSEEVGFERKVLRNKLRGLFKHHPDLDGKAPTQLHLDLLRNKEFDKR